MSQSILARSPNWVGDAVMSLPFFASLKKNAPDANVVCLTRSHLVPLYADAEGVDRVIILDESAGRSGLRSQWRNAGALRRERFDMVFCLPPSFGSALMLWMARINERVGHAADGRRWLLTRSLPYGRNGHRPHRTDGYLALLDLIWPGSEKVRALSFRAGKHVQDRVSRLWQQSGPVDFELVLAVGPGAAQPNKLWPDERFAALARRWIESTGGAVVLVGGPAERELCTRVARAVDKPAVFDFSGVGDLAFSAEIIRRSDMCVANDSGLSHLAAAVGTPTVVISGPGDPAEVAPYTPIAVTVKKPVFCSPCYRNDCWRRDLPLECQMLVTVDDVWNALVALHARSGGGGSEPRTIDA
ncbi:MAG: lipopolysaccharide heptosyltransferase II [Candidatus Zixiibacteriota bacterium]